MAMEANMRAFRSTYLDIGLGHIGRLRRLAHGQAGTTEGARTYQSADKNLAGTSLGGRGWVSSLGSSSLGGLLHTSNSGWLGRSATGTSTATSVASGLTTAADEIIKGLIKVGRHDCDG
jgi:hypothetical protein